MFMASNPLLRRDLTYFGKLFYKLVALSVKCGAFGRVGKVCISPSTLQCTTVLHGVISERVITISLLAG